VARGMLHMVQNKIYDTVNLGSGVGVTIKDTAETIATYLDRDIVWDISKPMGDMKRIMSTKILESYGFELKYDLKTGIEKTIDWYLNEGL